MITTKEWYSKLKDEVMEAYKPFREKYGPHLSKEVLDLFAALEEKDLEETKNLIKEVKDLNIYTTLGDESSPRKPLRTL